MSQSTEADFISSHPGPGWPLCPMASSALNLPLDVALIYSPLLLDDREWWPRSTCSLSLPSSQVGGRVPRYIKSYPVVGLWGSKAVLSSFTGTHFKTENILSLQTQVYLGFLYLSNSGELLTGFTLGTLKYLKTIPAINRAHWEFQGCFTFWFFSYCVFKL